MQVQANDTAGIVEFVSNVPTLLFFLPLVMGSAWDQFLHAWSFQQAKCLLSELGGCGGGRDLGESLMC